MVEYPRTNWSKIVLSYRGTVVRNILWRVFALTIYSLVVQCLYESGLQHGWLVAESLGKIDAAAYTALGSLLGFLIVFRTNSSSNRYWEGRSHWGMMINSSRSLARFAQAYVPPADELALLIAGYVLCVKQTLRGSRDISEAEVYLPSTVFQRAERFGNQPSAIVAAMSNWFSIRYRAGMIDTQQVRHAEDLMARMVDAQGGCEKIQKTPLPFVYAAMIKQLIILYLATFPLVVCDRMGWWTPLFITVIAFGFFGIEEAGVEIEDPFGLEINSLPLDAICVTIIRDTAEVTRESNYGLNDILSIDATQHSPVSDPTAINGVSHLRTLVDG
jgi:putative membrane protein